MFKEGQEVWVTFKEGSNKYKATVIATGEHFTCVHSWVGIPSMEKKEIVENKRVFALDYKVKTIKIGEFDVPEPLREAPPKGTRIYVVNLRSKHLQSSYLFGTVASSYTNELQDIARRQAHLTKEAAMLHAKALLSFTTTELPSETNK